MALDFLTCKIPFSSQWIIKAQVLSTFFLLFPFFVSDLGILAHNNDNCLDFFAKSTGYMGINVGWWMYSDGYIKLSVFAFVIFMWMNSIELRCETTILIINAHVLRFFYVFNIGWTITICSVFFAQITVNDQSTNTDVVDKLYTFCGQQIKGFVFSQAMCNFVIIPLGLYVSSLRPEFVDKDIQSQAKPLKKKQTK